MTVSDVLYIATELHGGTGNDTLTGGSGNDVFYGDEDAVTQAVDTIVTGGGANTIYTEGKDLFTLSTGNTRIDWEAIVPGVQSGVIHWGDGTQEPADVDVNNSILAGVHTYNLPAGDAAAINVEAHGAMGEITSLVIPANFVQVTPGRTPRALALSRRESGDLRLSFWGIPGLPYLTQSTTRLTGPQWQSGTRVVCGAGGIGRLDLPAPPGDSSMAFFRVIAEQDLLPP